MRAFEFGSATLHSLILVIWDLRLYSNSNNSSNETMGPTSSSRTISQQAFDEMVKENIEDLGMDPTEALQDAIQTLSLQGVNLSGIVTTSPGETNPVVETLDQLEQLVTDWGSCELVKVVELLDGLTELCKDEGCVAIATRKGGLELVICICCKIQGERGEDRDQCLVSALNALALLLHDLQSTEVFRGKDGPKIVISILNDGSKNPSILNSAFSVVAAAAAGNEVVKESFMDLKVDALIVQTLRENRNEGIPCIYDAICTLLTSDDNRVLASQVFGYARRLAKLGITEALVGSLRQGIRSPSLVSASFALKAVAVNEDICRSIAENGGIDATLCCVDDSGEQQNDTVARICCSLLTQLAGSDTNKSVIVEKGGMNRLIKLASRFSDDPSVLQEVMSIITVLSLRSPGRAAHAIEAGAGDLAIQAMQNFPESNQLQKNSCLMIRNLAVRNPENRTLLLGNGIEKLIRKAKVSHKNCQTAATDALRDLGLENYNS